MNYHLSVGLNTIAWADMFLAVSKPWPRTSCRQIWCFLLRTAVKMNKSNEFSIIDNYYRAVIFFLQQESRKIKKTSCPTIGFGAGKRQINENINL